MIINDYTAEEQARMDALEEEYQALLRACKEASSAVHSGEEHEQMLSEYKELRAKASNLEAPAYPDPVSYDLEGTPIYDPDEVKEYERLGREYLEAKTAAEKNVSDYLHNFFENQTSDLKELRREYLRLINELNEKRAALFREMEQRRFDELNGDPEQILENAREQETILIPELIGDGIEDAEELIARSKYVLRLHYDFFQDDEEHLQILNDIVLDAVAGASDVSLPENQTALAKLENIVTHFPTETHWPMDKVTSSVFGKANIGKKVKVDERLKGKEPTQILLDYEDLPKNVTVTEKLNHYDRAVLNAVADLCESGNRVVTFQTILKTMEGSDAAKLTPNHAQRIENSMAKLGSANIQIKQDMGSGETMEYQERLLYFRQATHRINGKIVDSALEILKQPILFRLASEKNQILRIPLKYLDTSIKKTPDNIILQNILLNHIYRIKGNKRQSNRITYAGIYEELGITAPTDGALRKKTSDIRENARKILEGWKKAGMITDYAEYKQKQTVYGIKIFV